MFMRIDKLQTELPAPKKQDPNAAAALQELLGGKYGEMSTLGNYMFQSFNFRSKAKLRPFYSLVASITAEELGHVELVSNGVAMLNNGPDMPATRRTAATSRTRRSRAMQDIRLAGVFLANGGGAMPMNSNAASWNIDMVTTTGNVVIDLLHNFHLECGARIHKLRVYETMTEPTGREVCGYLLVRGSRARPCLRAGAEEAHRRRDREDAADAEHQPRQDPRVPEVPGRGLAPPALHASARTTTRRCAGIWGNGELALPGDPPGELEVVDGHPEGGKIHDLTGEPGASRPDYAPEEMFEIATKLYKKGR